MKPLNFSAIRPTRILMIAGAALVLAACDGSGGTPEELVEQALEHRNEYKLRAAVIELKNALQQDPQNVNARGYLGVVSLDLGDIASAQKELERARDLGWPVENYVLPLTRTWVIRGEFNKVLDEFSVTDDMSSTAKARVLVARSEAWRGLREADKAEEELNKARALAPDEPSVYVGLARIALGKRDFDTSASFVEKAASLAPEDSDVLAIQGDLAFAREAYPEAEAAYLKLSQVQTGNPFPLLPLSRVMLVNGKTDEAIAELDKFLRVLPKHPVANFLRSRAAYDKKDYALALISAQSVLEVAPGHLPSQLLAGSASYATESYQQAESYLSKYLNADPDNPAARRLLGITQLRLGESAKSLETLTPLVGEDVDDAQLLSLAGQAALQSRNFDTSRRYFEQAAKANPDSARARAQLGVVETATGNIEEGIKDLEQAVAEDPELNEAVLALGLANLRAQRYDAAIETARKLQANRPEAPIGYMLEGIANLGLKNNDAAKASFDKVLELRPGAPDASANLAAMDLQAGNVDAARQRLNSVFEHFPDDVGTIIRLADLEIREQNIEPATEWLRKAVQVQPTATEPKIRLAQLLFSRGEFEEALTVGESALATEPDNPRILETVGRTQLALGQTSAARSTLQNLVRLTPDFAPSAYMLSLVYRAERNLPEYRKQLERTLEIDPNHLRAKSDLAVVAAQMGEKELPQQYLAELREVAPGNPYVLELEGVIALGEERYAEAIASFTEALKTLKTTQLALNLATAQRRSGDKAASNQTLENWVEEFPRDLQARFVLANNLLTDSDFDLAAVHYLKIVEFFPDNVAALNNLAWVLLQQNRADEALPHVEHAMEVQADDPRIMDTAALVYLELDKAGQAVALLRKASKALPDSSEIQLHLAQALARTGQRDEARDVVSRLLADNPEFPERQDAQTLLKDLGG